MDRSSSVDSSDGKTPSGFDIVSSEELPNLQAKGVLYRHLATGCEIYYLHREDPENFFMFAFKTPPENDQGIPHILEHSVLSGSRRFPVKDPFQWMLKGSAYTFMNAMTYPTKTIYPAATMIEQDYFNLFRLYADAVFFPLLKWEVFQQEGHRLEYRDGNLGITGIVYNEMKGAHSSPDRLAWLGIVRSIFAGSPYQFDAGGIPAAIPDLTVEGLREFHRIHYHPSNCKILLYGSIPAERQLELLNSEYLCHFEMGREVAEIPSYSDWTETRTMRVTLPLGEGDDATGKSSIVVGWKCNSPVDLVGFLALEILEEILIGNVGSPVHKAILESEIGEDLFPGCGLEIDMKETIFVLGIRGCNEDDTAKVESVIFSTLEQLVQEGIPGECIQGAFHQVEFENREIPGGIPYGLRLSERILRSWMHHMPPGKLLQFPSAIKEVRERLSREPRFFENLIERELLNNPSRSLVVAVPDPEHQSRVDETIVNRLATVKSAMSPEDIEALKEVNRRYTQFEESVDDEDAIATIPTLRLGDLPRELSRINTVVGECNRVPLFTHPMFTNQVCYVEFAFNVAGLSDEDSLLLPLMAQLLHTTGLPGQDYSEVARQLAVLTGEVSCSPTASRGLDISPKVDREFLIFRMRALEDNIEEAITLVGELLLKGMVNDEGRIQDTLLEQRNDFKSGLLPAGSTIAALRGRSKVSGIVRRDEGWSGLNHYLWVCDRLKEDNGIAHLAGRLEELRSRLFNRSRLSLNITADDTAIPRVEKLLSGLVGRLPVGELSAPATLVPFDREGEVLIGPALVGYSATVLPASMVGEDGYQGEQLLGHYLRTNTLWEEIRMRGGAYGVSASAYGMEGSFCMSSYRDPDVQRTLGIYRTALEDAASQTISREQLESGVIRLVAREAHPLSPGEASIVGFKRCLYGVTDELRGENLRRLLAVTPEEVRRAAERLLDRWEDGVSVVLVGKDLDGNFAKEGIQLSVTTIIPM